jgi:hypothetical protein
MKPNRGYFIAFILSAGIWFYFSYIFRFDRLYGDAAAYLFNIINELKFSIAHQRPAGYLIEFIPLILARSNASMESIIAWMSFNESIVLILFSFTAVFLMKDVKLGLAVLLPFFLGDRYNYFNPVSELILAAPVLILSIGCLDKYGTRIWANLLFLPMIIFLIFSHPLYNLLLPVSYLLLLLNKKMPIKWILIHTLTLILTMVYRYITLMDYDKKQLAVEHHLDIFNTIQFYLNHSNTVFLLQSFLGLIIVTLVSLYLFYKAKKKLMAIIGFLFSAGMILLILYKFSHLFPDTMEPFERYLFPVSVFSGLLFYFSTQQRDEKWIPYLLIAVFIYQSVQLFNYGKVVQNRNLQLKGLIEYAQSHNESKVIVKYSNFNPKRLGHDWIMTTESMLLSRIIGNRKLVQAAVYESFDPALRSNITPFQYVHFPWWAIDINSLNPEYFRFYPQPFSHCNTPTDSQTVAQLEGNKFKIELSPSGFKVNKKADAILAIITNNSNITVSSGLEAPSVLLGYCWRQDGNDVMFREGFPLLADLRPGKLKQLLFLDMPSKKGNYNLSFYFLINGKDRIYLNSLSDISVD